MEKEGQPVTFQTRRGVLKGIGAASVSTLLGGSFPARATTDGGETTILGDFESGLDGWQATGSEMLERIETAERPVAVTKGTHGLQVTAGDDLEPAIANESRVHAADFVEHPFLFATVTPDRVLGTGAHVAVQFRLHSSSDALLDGDSVVQSATTTVRPHVSNVVAWDLRGIDETARADATRLEIAWWPETDRSVDELLGGDSGNEWTVVFDDVHLSDDQRRVELVRLADHWERLKFANGTYRDTRVHSRSGGVESGEFVFGDGVSVPYSVERLADGGTRYVLDGVAYRLGGDVW